MAANSEVLERHDREPVGCGADFKSTRRRVLRLLAIADRVSDELLHCLFHRTRPERLVNASPHQEFKSGLGNREVDPRSRNRANFGHRQPGHFALSLRGKGPEHDLLVEASDELRSEKSVQFGDYRPFQRGERKAGRDEELLRANIARAHDVETRKIIGMVVRKCDAGGIEHLQEEIPYQAVGLFDFVEEKDASLVCERTFPSRPVLPVSSPMNNLTLSR